MIGLILNEQLSKTSIDKINLAVNKLLLMTSQVIIPADNNDFDTLKAHFDDKKNVEVITHLSNYQNCGTLTDIYAASCQHPDMTDFLTIEPKHYGISPEVISTLSENQNSFAATTTTNFYTIGHFQIQKDDLISYLNLENFELEEFITDELQCLPITFAKSDFE
ncbi:hypothetical protein [Companilactobacillus jidongensis]|uniref:hypothetical protein n=1 Tax=Companilactobacillus jidongensis TaxID=2486006 RepID=UPI000F766F66|nr:hypothetical protein [Companilactobacillus jidongensis]